MVYYSVISMNRVFIIAEAGVNHNGDKNLAFRLCDAAKAAGVDAVKFQTWKTEKIVTKSAALAEYQENNLSDKVASQFEMLKQLELSYNEFVEVRDYCNQIGIQFLSTPDTEEDMDFLLSLGIPILKIGSGEVTNIPFLRAIGKRHQKVILSTGMSTLSDVEKAYNTLLESGANEVSLLHCTTNYPCPYNEVNLQAMQTLKAAFKCQVGYSDHTMGIEVPIAAVAMGAEIIEKHFTLDRTMEGPDHLASLEPQELKQMVNCIRNIEQALGDGIKRPNASEKMNSEVVLKRIIAKQPIKAGDILNESNLALLRSSSGIPAKFWDLVAGKQATRDYQVNEPIQL
jgi:N-acetylneuraminate synthase/N,N'-diacetyllegionaminate synthase